MQLLGCTESSRFSPPMHTYWHLPSRSRRTRRRMMGKALSGGTSAATRRVTRAWWYTGTLTTGVCTACPTRPPRVILTEATGSPDPLIELTNRLGRMTDWAALDAAEGINQLVPPGWTLRILSSMSEGVCEWLIQRDREFLNVWASCGQ